MVVVDVEPEKSWPESTSKIGTALLSQHNSLESSFTFWYVRDGLVQRVHSVIVLFINLGATK